MVFSVREKRKLVVNCLLCIRDYFKFIVDGKLFNYYFFYSNEN